MKKNTKASRKRSAPTDLTARKGGSVKGGLPYIEQGPSKPASRPTTHELEQVSLVYYKID